MGVGERGVDIDQFGGRRQVRRHGLRALQAQTAQLRLDAAREQLEVDVRRGLRFVGPRLQTRVQRLAFGLVAPRSIVAATLLRASAALRASRTPVAGLRPLTPDAGAIPRRPIRPPVRTTLAIARPAPVASARAVCRAAVLGGAVAILSPASLARPAGFAAARARAVPGAAALRRAVAVRSPTSVTPR